MSKAVKKAKKPSKKAPAKASRGARKVPGSRAVVQPTSFPASMRSTFKTPPSPYAQAILFALAILVTAIILFAAVQSAHPRLPPPKILASPTAEAAPRIEPPPGPPPFEAEIEAETAMLVDEDGYPIPASPLEPTELR